jgi:two-component system, NtrC family, response regulator HydG
MNPRLIATDGPLEGEILPISSGECTLGRDRSAAIHVPDPSVSRQHCTIRVDPEGQVQIVDAQSRNGTFVNGLPVGEHVLGHGDEVRVGACHFLFLTRQEPATQPGAFLMESAALETRTIVQLRRHDALYLRPDEAMEGAAEPARVAHNLKALLRASRTVRATRGVEELAHDLAELITQTIPASELALLLFENTKAEPVWSFSWTAEEGPRRELPVPDNLVRQAFENDIAILTNDPGTVEPRSDGTDEMLPKSVLLAPLSGADGVVGVVYLGSADILVTFDEEQLQVLTAIASVSGMALENAVQFDRLRAENRRLREEIALDHDMVGDTPPMEAVYLFISKVAPTDATVLITGESGTGKELVARAIHRNSKRSGGPFIAVNCAALNESLLESELFGHEKGAFTGAIIRKQGKFEVADGGTIFLDEIGEMPASLQAKLLRVLQERAFERVGGNKQIQVNVRIITATNRDLPTEIRENKFREDLYYRLNVVSVRMPALRERRDDIPMLADFFASRFGTRLGRPVRGVNREAAGRMMAYDWPGNVRELENAIERAVVLGSSPSIVPDDLPGELLEVTPPTSGETDGYHAAVREAKRQIILQALGQANGSQKEAAGLLGVNPTYLSRLIRNLDLK